MAWRVGQLAEAVLFPRVGKTVKDRVDEHWYGLEEETPIMLGDEQSFDKNGIRHALVSALVDDGFAFAEGPAVRSNLEKNDGLSDWRAFAESWADLPVDRYMADGGMYRMRRYSVFSTRSASEKFQLEPLSPHFQSLTCNSSNGGIERWYEPLHTEIINGNSLRTILKETRMVFEQLSPNRTWHIEVHQFRIEVAADDVGKPTPEGVHRDGVAFGMVMMIDRTNVLNGETTIYRNRYSEPIGRSTLRQPLECLFFVDTEVRHVVSSIIVKNPAHSGTRDVLVVTFSTAPR